MAAWVRDEKKVSENRQRKREAEEADKIEVAPRVTVASLRRFRAALIGPTPGLPKRRWLRREKSLKTIPERENTVLYMLIICLWVQMRGVNNSNITIVAIRGGIPDDLA